MTARTRRRPGVGAPAAEQIADRHQQLDCSETRRRAAVALFVDVIAEHRPMLTEADLDDLRRFLLARPWGRCA